MEVAGDIGAGGLGGGLFGSDRRLGQVERRAGCNRSGGQDGLAKAKGRIHGVILSSVELSGRQALSWSPYSRYLPSVPCFTLVVMSAVVVSASVLVRVAVMVQTLFESQLLIWIFDTV